MRTRDREPRKPRPEWVTTVLIWLVVVATMVVIFLILWFAGGKDLGQG